MKILKSESWMHSRAAYLKTCSMQNIIKIIERVGGTVIEHYKKYLWLKFLINILLNISSQKCESF